MHLANEQIRSGRRDGTEYRIICRRYRPPEIDLQWRPGCWRADQPDPWAIRWSGFSIDIGKLVRRGIAKQRYADLTGRIEPLSQFDQQAEIVVALQAFDGGWSDDERQADGVISERVGRRFNKYIL